MGSQRGHRHAVHAGHGKAERAHGGQTTVEFFGNPQFAADDLIDCAQKGKKEQDCNQCIHALTG